MIFIPIMLIGIQTSNVDALCKPTPMNPSKSTLQFGSCSNNSNTKIPVLYRPTSTVDNTTVEMNDHGQALNYDKSKRNKIKRNIYTFTSWIICGLLMLSAFLLFFHYKMYLYGVIVFILAALLIITLYALYVWYLKPRWT